MSSYQWKHTRTDAQQTSGVILDVFLSQAWFAILLPQLCNACFIDAGTLKLMDSSEQLLWSVQVDHQLFALQKLDVTVSRLA